MAKTWWQLRPLLLPPNRVHGLSLPQIASSAQNGLSLGQPHISKLHDPAQLCLLEAPSGSHTALSPSLTFTHPEASLIPRLDSQTPSLIPSAPVWPPRLSPAQRPRRHGCWLPVSACPEEAAADGGGRGGQGVHVGTTDEGLLTKHRCFWRSAYTDSFSSPSDPGCRVITIPSLQMRKLEVRDEAHKEPGLAPRAVQSRDLFPSLATNLLFASGPVTPTGFLFVSFLCRRKGSPV